MASLGPERFGRIRRPVIRSNYLAGIMAYIEEIVHIQERKQPPTSVKPHKSLSKTPLKRSLSSPDEPWFES